MKQLIMARRHAFISIAAVLATIGCASINDQMASWMGHHQQELILDWGPPTRERLHGADGWILIHEYDRNFGQIPGHAYVVGFTETESSTPAAGRVSSFGKRRFTEVL